MKLVSYRALRLIIGIKMAQNDRPIFESFAAKRGIGVLFGVVIRVLEGMRRIDAGLARP